MKKIILVDGSSWLYRAFHALPRLSAPGGEPSGAIFGMGNMLRKLLKDYDPEHIAVIFDPKGKTFRHELYADYKAHRPPVPPELAAQFEPMIELIQIMGLPILQENGVEADDVIATLARQAESEGAEVLVVSGDKDLAQIVNARVALLDTMKDLRLDEAAVFDKYGIRPEQVVDWLALMGDSADNIPGIPGVGAKTAAKWLREFDDLDTLVERAEEVKGKIGEKLRAHLGQIPLSRELAKVRNDLPMDVQIKTLNRRPLDQEAFDHFCRSFGFQRWIEASGPPLKRSSDDKKEHPALNIQTVLAQEELLGLARSLKDCQRFAVDTETDQLDPQRARLVGLSFAINGKGGWYVPVAHDYLGAPVQCSLDAVRAVLGPILADAEKEKIVQHGKYDMHILSRHGMPLAGVRFDTMLESYVLNSSASRHDMDSLAQHYLGLRTISFKEVAGSGRKQLSFNQIGLDAAAEYAVEDAAVTYALHECLDKALAQEPGLKTVYDTIEQPLIAVLQRIEATGVHVDARKLAEASTEFADRMNSMEHRAQELAGRPFNLNSPNQLQTILFDDLKLPVLRKTPKGAASTAEDVLQELALQHELPRLILDWRALAKLRSTYTEKLPANINPQTGRIHTSYHQAVATTGRLSSAEPNLQNIPVRNEDGRRIRQAFTAPQGKCIAALDYSQIELRLMAHFSQDPNMLEAFQQGQDIHSRTAADVFEVPVSELSSDQRRAAKAINFGLIYGISAFGLARNLGISRVQAQAHMDRFFSRYAGVARYMGEVKERARDLGYVETLFGRRMYLTEIKDRNQARRQAAERLAINAPLQGTAADIIKLAMIQIDRQLDEIPGVNMIMQVHDELVFEFDREQAQDRMSELVSIMEGVVSLDVPLKVDAGMGKNWDEAHG